MRDVEGILCDLDGTLVDSEPCHLEAWNRMVEQAGATPEEGWGDDTVGLPDSYTADKAVRLYPVLAGREGLLDMKQEMLREIVRQRGVGLIFPGVEDCLRRAREAGVKLAVGTNSIRMNVETTLRATGLDRYFDAVISIDMVENGKPAPDIYSRAARDLGLEPDRCVVLEDSEAGVRAGKAAGCRVLGIEGRYSAGKLGGADRLFSGTAAALSWLLNERTTAHVGD